MKRLVSIILVLTFAFALAACGSSADSTSSEAEETQSVAESSDSAEISGTVSAVEGNVITLTSTDGAELEITVTDSTEYSFEMAEMTEMPQGEGQQGEGMPEMPTGDAQQGGEVPEMPQGGEMPQGDANQGENPPEKPEGDAQQGGEMPEMPQGEGQQGGEVPEMPSGDFQQGGEMTEMPQGEGQQGGEMPEMPSGGDMPEDFQLGLDMITSGTQIKVTLAEDGTASEIKIVMAVGAGNQQGGDFGGGQPGGTGSSGSDIEYTAVNTYSENTALSDQSFVSTGADENAVLVTDGQVTISRSSIERTSSNSTGGDNSSFYGVGAAVLATGGTAVISESDISTDSAGGAGVFAYGDGIAYVYDSSITTAQGTSGGIHVAGGGTLYAWDLDVETQGESSAAIRSDRGSGTMVVDGGSYTSNGTGSPAIYSTADITVNGATLVSNQSEAICIEGKNSIRLYDCDLTGNMSDSSQNDCTWNVILYQSMSGDSDVGNSLFEMVGGTLTAGNGGMFYTTNTQSTFVLSGVELSSSSDSEFLLKCTGNSNQRGWGSAGANGAQCSFTAIAQNMSGDVIWDSISTLDFYLTDGSTLTGAFINDESNAGNGGSGYAALYIGKDSTWVVTGNSTLTSLQLSGSIVDTNGLIVSVVGTDGTVYVNGTSEYTVTVESFSAKADLTGCSSVSSFSDYAVEKK